MQELIGGTLRRHTFTPCEVELLLDLQTCRIRKSAKAEILRRYLRAVQQDANEESTVPLRFMHFFEQEAQKMAPQRAFSPEEKTAKVAAS